MSFASGPITCVRFVISHSFRLDDAFFAAINRWRFGQTPPDAKHAQVGWIGPRHVLDGDLSPGEIVYGRFARLQMRVDQLKAPPAIVRARVKQAEQAALLASGREFLSRGERRLAKEAALEELQREIRDGKYRRHAAYDVLFEPQSNHVYFGTHSRAAAEHLAKLIHATFGWQLDEDTPERLAREVAEVAKTQAQLEALTPFHLAKPFDGADFPPRDLNFLGVDFATWLWFESERNFMNVRAELHGGVRLECEYGLNGTDTLACDQPNTMPEARAALRIGKKVTKLGLVLSYEQGGAAVFVLDARRLAISGLKFPNLSDDGNPREYIEQRFEELAATAREVAQHFKGYVRLRLHPEWHITQQQLRNWAATGHADLEPEE